MRKGVALALMVIFLASVIIGDSDGRKKCSSSTEDSEVLPNCPRSDTTDCRREIQLTDECYQNSDCLPGSYCCKGACGNNECATKRRSLEIFYSK